MYVPYQIYESKLNKYKIKYSIINYKWCIVMKYLILK